MAGKLSGSAIQSGTITSTQLSTELGPVASELQLVGSGVSLNVSNTAVFSGNVGIGTATPSESLDVLGKVTVNSDGTLNWGNAKDFGKLTWSFGGIGNPDKAVIRAESGKALSLGANGNQDYLLVSTSGNVGIGTTNPQALLQVGGTATGYPTLDITGSQEPSLYLRFGIGYAQLYNSYGTIGLNAYLNGEGKNLSSSVLYFRGYNNTAAAYLQLFDGKIHIAGGGNVGIGTTSPTQKLHVSGTIRANEFVGSNTSYYLIPDSTSYLRSAYFTQSDTTNGYVQIGENYVYGVDNATGGSFELRNNGNSFITGNVGIGTTSPTFKLHVVNGKLGINGGGNGSLLSIGGYTPKAWDFAQTIELGNKVASISGEDGISTIHVGTNAYFDGSNWRYATSDSVALYDQYYGEHRFYTASSGTSGNVISWAQSVTITESGSVGIATTSPTQKLHVNGLVRANEFVGSNASWYLIPDDTSYLKEAYWTTNPASGTYLYTYPTYLQAVNSSTGRTFAFDTGTGNSYINLGNIGIGTTSPSAKLHIDNGANNALYIKTTVADSNTRDGIYLFESDGQATGRQAISWYNGNQGYYKARIWTEVGSSYAATRFSIEVANNARTVAERFWILNGNSFTSGTLTQNASDKRLKENIQNIPNALEKISKINGVKFNWASWTRDMGFDSHDNLEVGVIAQEIQEILPEAVKPAPFDSTDGISKSGENYLTVQIEKLVPLLIEAIKELKAEIDLLKNT